MSNFVAIDVETANAFMGSICQIGAVRFEDGREVEHISWLVDPRDYFDPINVSIHRIDEQTVRGQPCFAERHRELFEFTTDAVTVCHTHFDRVALTYVDHLVPLVVVAIEIVAAVVVVAANDS